MSPGYGAAVVLWGHADRLPVVVSLVNEADVQAGKVESPDEEVEVDASAVLLCGLALRCVSRFGPSRVDGRAEHVRRLPAIVFRFSI